MVIEERQPMRSQRESSEAERWREERDDGRTADALQATAGKVSELV